MNINYREYLTKATPAPDRDHIDVLNEIITIKSRPMDY